MSYSRELVDDLLKASDIVSVISSYIPVIQKGRSYLAICPFHDDKNPSLNISKEKQIFKCFSCGAGGNALTFVQKYEKITFDEAVRKLAQISGFDDPRLSSERHEKHINPDIVPLYKCINDLQLYYRYGLATEEGKIAKEYLNKRNISDEEAEKFGIGYALSDGKKTIQYLQTKGHSLKSIEDIGIALARAEGTADSNAGRLIFSLADPDGQVIGFSARRLRDDKSAKYVNSPETRIFQKGKMLYNYHIAKETARHDGYIYVLEGFMDVISMAKAGIQSAVAVMGTNLTDEQIHLLRRLKCEIRLCLDGDAAGQEGMMRIVNKLSKAALPFRIVSNPGDLRDPDDIFQEDGKDGLIEAMNHLVDPFDFQLNYYLNVKQLTSPEDRLRVLRYFIPFLRTIPAGIERENYIAKLARVSGYEADVIRGQIAQVEPGKSTKEENEAASQFEFDLIQPSRTFVSRLDNAERETLFYMLNEPDAVRYFRQSIDTFYNETYQAIANFILDYEQLRQSKIDVAILMNDIASSGVSDAELYEAKLSEIASDNYHPNYSEDQIVALAKVIREEKDKINDKIITQQKALGKPGDERAKLYDEFMKKKKREFAQKSKKSAKGEF